MDHKVYYQRSNFFFFYSSMKSKIDINLQHKSRLKSLRRIESRLEGRNTDLGRLKL